VPYLSPAATSARKALSRYLALLLIPLRPAVLCTLIILGAALAAALKAGPFGLPLIVILSIWLFKYSFIFLDRVVSGGSEAPVLSLEMISSSMGDLRTLLPLIVVLFALFASGAAMLLMGTAAAITFAAVLLYCLPAVIAVQGWTGRLTQSLSLQTCRVMVRVLGADYAWIIGCALLVTAICIVVPGLVIGTPIFVRISTLIYAWLAMIAVIGGALHEYRELLERAIPLVVAQQVPLSSGQCARLQEIWLDSIYAAWRSDAVDNAWRRVKDRIDESEEPLQELRWLYGRVARWQPPRFSNRVAQEILTCLLRDENRESEALWLFKERLAIEPGFQPKTKEESRRLVEFARRLGDHRSAEAIIVHDDR
jgi:hypothetical protein